MEFTNDFAAAHQRISQALVASTRTATRLAAEDIAFHRSSTPAVATDLDRADSRLLQLTERLLNCARVSDTTSPRYNLTDFSAVESQWRRIVDTADNLFERVDTCLDEYTGLLKRNGIEEAVEKPTPRNRRVRLSAALRDNSEIPKPQLYFESPPLNDEKGPFRPFLTQKPHAKVPFTKSFEKFQTHDGLIQYEHPYATEIEQSAYPSSCYQRTNPVPYNPFDTTSATFVDTPEALNLMIEELKGATEIAVDLEHHDTHSYLGIVCLMQISTRNRDWIVDTLKPWRRKLEALNDVFTDPAIVKVFHGAHMDILWLQRDFSLYVVGLFDTHHASRVLGYAGGSLSFLLKKFIDFDAQKQYQTADWRNRPLPAEMLDYARSDTHFLLYIYDNMRNELIDNSDLNDPSGDLLQEVLTRSKGYALHRYEYPTYNDSITARRNGWAPALVKWPEMLSKQQVAVFAKVHQWRDKVAREEDESVLSIMPNHVLLAIARSGPVDMATLLSVWHPFSNSLRARAKDLLGMISTAFKTAETGPSMTDILAAGSGSSFAKESRTPATIGGTASESIGAAGDGETRSRKSRLWGQSLPSPSNAQYNITNTVRTDDNYVISFSISEHLDTSLEEPFANDAPSKMLSGPPAENQPSLTYSNGMPSKRAAEEEEEEAEVPVGEEGREEEESARALAKVQRRAERKANKRARKESLEVGGVAVGDNTQSDVIDYEAAPSVLHASSASGIRQSKRAPVDPSTNLTDSPQGAKLPRRPATGKSMTFR